MNTEFLFVNIIHNIGNWHYFLYLIKRLLKVLRSGHVFDYLDHINECSCVAKMTETDVAALNKIGLRVKYSCIVRDDSSVLFYMYCLLLLTEGRIPPFTSSIEAVHGHLNNLKYRSSSLIKKFETLVQFIIKRVLTIERSLKTNFARQINAFHRKKIRQNR
jgi:hypothetical protein